MRPLLAALLVSVLAAACAHSSYTTPVPDVHVRVVLYLDPPLAGNCCKVVTVNPSSKPVYLRCRVTVYGKDGTVSFQGYLASGPAGWYAPPGTHSIGSAAVSDPSGRVLQLHDQRYSTQCDTFVWHGQPPI